MSRLLLTIVGCSSLIGLASAACAAADHANCPIWIKAGFCDNYTPVVLAQWCPKSCPKAGCGGKLPTTPTNTTTATENKNCAKWNEDPKNAFCASATDVQKKTFCKTTCAKEITPTEDCAYYVTRKGMTKTNAPGTGEATGATATDMLLHVFTKDKCKVELYPSATPAPPTALIKAYTGAAPTLFFKITAANEQAAVGITCTCTP